MLNTKYQSSNPSSFREKNFEVGFLCSYVPTCDPRGEASFDPMSIILDRCPQGDAKNQISKLDTIQLQRKRILKMGFFIHMFQLVTPGVGPIFTLGASYEQTW